MTDKKCLLLVEDSEDLVKMYRMALDQVGAEVVIAKNADEGLEKVRQEKPALVILDLLLPGEKNGDEVLKQMQGDMELKNIPVLVLTNVEEDREKLLKLGAVDYLVKADIDITSLVERVKRFFE